ncbi:putative glycosyltransferase EpsE [Clostridia bacterium]|nr:putative glycosyltransferase EpsE [Clostridia bacterium]
MPLISVLLPVHNAEKTIERAVDSIINQTFSDWELIICDDGSVDSTYNILCKKYINSDDRIHIIRNVSNKGIVYTLNKCIQASHGRYIARMDADDISKPVRLEIEITFLRSNLEFSIVSSRAECFDELGAYRILGKEGEIRSIDMITGRNTYIHPATMLYADALRFVNGYDMQYNRTRNEDSDLFFRLAHNGFRGYVLDDVLLSYYDSRITPKQQNLQNRFSSSKIIMRWIYEFKFPLWYVIFSFKFLILGILPKRIYYYLHFRDFHR